MSPAMLMSANNELARLDISSSSSNNHNNNNPTWLQTKLKELFNDEHARVIDLL